MLRLLILLVFYSSAVHGRCSESDQIECGTSDRCTRIQYICDGDNDCGDHSDEESDLCRAWRDSSCSRGSFSCHRESGTDCVSIREFCNNEIPPCDNDFDMRICVMLQNEKLLALEDIPVPQRGGPGGEYIPTNLDESETLGEDFIHMVDHTLQSEKCPILYTRVGDECLSFFFFGSVAWGEARSFCQTIGGDLFVPESDAEYQGLVHHLKEYHMTSDFWIGGNYYNDTTGWRWVNDQPIELGTPHWTLRHTMHCTPRLIHIEYRNATLEALDGECFSYYQAPAEQPEGNCVAMTYDKLFFLSDENCLLKKSPLCKLIHA